MEGRSPVQENESHNCLEPEYPWCSLVLSNISLQVWVWSSVRKLLQVCWSSRGTRAMLMTRRKKNWLPNLVSDETFILSGYSNKAQSWSVTFLVARNTRCHESPSVAFKQHCQELLPWSTLKNYNPLEQQAKNCQHDPIWMPSRWVRH